jgi:hypothetical protein
MDEQDKEKRGGVQPRDAERLSEEELARILGQSGWTKQEAAAVLLAQKRSGRSVMDFAALHGISGCRLYYWRKRCPQPTVEEEPELAPEALQQALGQELDPEAAGDSQVQQYVMRAVRTEDKMWSVFALRASGSVLRCVVRWAGSCGPSPYSVVELDRTAPALRWQDFATQKEALAAFEQQIGNRMAPTSEGAVPLLLPVKVRAAGPLLPVARAKEKGAENRKHTVTVVLPSGVRIRIPNGADPELIRTVLGTTLGAPS